MEFKPIVEKDTELVVDKEKGCGYLVDNAKHRLAYQKIRLTPISALILSFMDGNYSINEIAEMLSRITQLEINCCRESIIKCVDMFQGQIVHNNMNNVRIMPSPDIILRYVRKYNQNDLTTSVFPDFPLGLVYMATQNCGFYCKYCFQGAGKDSNKEEKYLCIERWNEVIKEASNAGTNSLIIGGGDPMLRKDLEKYIAAASKFNLYSIASTRMELSEKRIESLINSGLKCIQLSLDSFDNKTVDFLSGREGTYDGLTMNLKRLAKYNIDITIRSVLTKYNIGHYKDWVDFCIEKGATSLASTIYFASCGRHDKDLYPTKEQALKLLEDGFEVKDKYKNSGIPIYLDSNYASFMDSNIKYVSVKRPYCLGSKSQILIKHDGKVSFCDSLTFDERFVVGDVNEKGIREIWQSDKMNFWRNPPREKFQGTECENCQLFYKCLPKRCYLRSEVANGSPFTKDPWCSINKNSKDTFLV